MPLTHAYKSPHESIKHIESVPNKKLYSTEDANHQAHLMLIAVKIVKLVSGCQAGDLHIILNRVREMLGCKEGTQ